MDIFENTILCKNCSHKMEKATILKNGLQLRALKCPTCSHILIHPNDEAEYERFKNLQSKTYKVKLRLVGNSYAVSIPREIVDFIKLQEKIMDDMVRLCFEDAKKVNLTFQ